MNNKYFDKLNEIKAKYGPQLKHLMAMARKEVIECEDIYNEKAVGRKQQEVVTKYEEEIRKVQNLYIEEVQKMINHEALLIKAMSDNQPKDNVERLLQAMELNNKIMLNQIKMSTMTEGELLKLMNNQKDEVIFDLAKAQLFKVADKLENGAQIKSQARLMNVVTDESLLNEVAVNLKQDTMNLDLFMPGMSIADTLTVNNKGGIRGFISQDMKLNSNSEEA